MRAPQAIGPRLIRFAHFGGDDDGCGHGPALTVRARHRYHALVIPNLIGDPWSNLSVQEERVDHGFPHTRE
jgi:hypothetical protein